MILFPRHPLHQKLPDPSFKDEFDAAIAAGFKIGLVDTDNGYYVHANIPALYRGWILKPGYYEDLCTAEPNLIVGFSDYMNSYNFPEWYRQVYPSTPKSVFFGGTQSSFLVDGKFNVARVTVPSVTSWEGHRAETVTIGYLGNTGLIVKDWVKSRKHEWLDACFIPDPNDLDNLARVVTNFINGQGDDLVGGLVFREYVKLKLIGNHPKSGLPLVNEHRFFVFKEQIFYSAPYWDAAFYGLANVPDKKVIIDLIPRIKSKFFALDVAEKEDGGWIVIEVNDGGTAGIPEGGNALEFYQALRELF
jgi:hypothetical protein